MAPRSGILVLVRSSNDYIEKMINSSKFDFSAAQYLADEYNNYFYDEK